ncbi:helix-turn-helix domain-containing protein, partial [Levilactobacillus tujiorum]|uniref:helix-turn-helix domain-containing protein n=1 Tax=Levilactobacillus tujiorum TaxID=2912243 RepID=UPI001E5A3A0E
MVVSIENKIKAVEDYLSDRGESYTIVATRYGIGRYALRVLTGIYQVHGREKLLNPPHITGEFRVNLVEWKEKNHASLEATCIKFGFPKPTSVSN